MQSVDRRTKFVLLRVNLAERRLLEAAAAAHDRPVATWTRQAALTAALRKLTTDTAGKDDAP